MARILIGNIKGPQGIQGIPGPTGPRGLTGPQGPLPPLTNNALATQAGVSALDAVMGKTLDEKIGGVISDLTDLVPNAQTLLLAYGLGQTKLFKNASGSADLGTDLSDKNYKSGIRTILRISDGKLRLIKQTADGTETYQDIVSL